MKEALTGPDEAHWLSTMEKGIESLYANNFWDSVKLPRGCKVIGNKWVFKLKTGADGLVERHKARLVAQGFFQKFGSDYDETFCPVVRFELIRTVIALAVQNGLKLHQMDVTTAFLNGELEDKVYMKQPEGFVDKDRYHLVCKLKCSIYGLKQSLRCWNSALDVKLSRIGFVQTTTDPCLCTSTEGETFIIAIYVDDMLLSGKSDKQMKEVKEALAKQFEVKHLKELCTLFPRRENCSESGSGKHVNWSTCLYRKHPKEIWNGEC